MSSKWPGFLSPPAQTFLFDHRWPLLPTASEMSLTSSFCLSVYITLHLNLLRNHKKIWKYINMTLIRHFCYVHERKIVIQTTPNSVSTTSFPRLCLQRCVTDFVKGPTEEDTHKVLDTIPSVCWKTLTFTLLAHVRYKHPTVKSSV